MDSSDETTDFLAFGSELVEPRALKPPGTSTVDFDGLLHPPLRLHEDLADGCGGMLWPAGMVLAKYVLRHPELMRDKTIVELGAGGGLVGLATALAFAGAIKPPLYITDQVPMLSLMKTNIALNGLHTSTEALIYDWGSNPPCQIPVHPNIILAADCVYFEPAFPLLQKTLGDLIGEGTVCYFCFKKRRRADLHFVKAIKKLFCVEEVEDDEDREVYGRENIYLYKITKKPS